MKLPQFRVFTVFNVKFHTEQYQLYSQETKTNHHRHHTIKLATTQKIKPSD
jgi:hypothetical protein